MTTRLPLCREHGDTCDDFAAASDGVCRYHMTTRRGSRCALAYADAGPMSDNEIGAVLGISGVRVGQIAAVATHRMVKRGAVAGLRQWLDVDRFAATREAIRPEDEADDGRRSPRRAVGLSASILDAIRSGVTGPGEIGKLLGKRSGDVASLVCHLIARGLVRRVRRGVYEVVETDAKEVA